MKKFRERGFIILAGLLIVALAGCAAYQSQTTVFGIEVAYQPTSSVTPTVRAGVITHRQNAASSEDVMRRMKNSVDYYDVSLFTGSGTLHGNMEIEPIESKDKVK